MTSLNNMADSIRDLREENGAQPGRAAIEIEAVNKTYRTGRGDVVALEDVGLDLAAGQFMALVGPSGCGKSTLLKMIAGLITPSSGSVKVLDKPVVAPGRDVGMMFQKPVLLPWRNVLDNVLLPVDVQNLGRNAYRSRADELLAMTGLEQFARHNVWELSGGMQQRVALCRTLVLAPKVLLLDEPFGALDSITRESLNDSLLEICARIGVTAVLVTHDVSEAVYLADTVVVMTARPGRVSAVTKIALGSRSPLTRDSEEYHQYCRQVRHQLSA